MTKDIMHLDYMQVSASIVCRGKEFFSVSVAVHLNFHVIHKNVSKEFLKLAH